MEGSLRIGLEPRGGYCLFHLKRWDCGPPTVLESGFRVQAFSGARCLDWKQKVLCRVSGSEGSWRDCKLCLKGVLIEVATCHMETFQKRRSDSTMNKLKPLKPCTYIYWLLEGLREEMSSVVTSKRRTQSNTAEKKSCFLAKNKDSLSW